MKKTNDEMFDLVEHPDGVCFNCSRPPRDKEVVRRTETYRTRIVAGMECSLGEFCEFYKLTKEDALTLIDECHFTEHLRIPGLTVTELLADRLEHVCEGEVQNVDR